MSEVVDEEVERFLGVMHGGTGARELSTESEPAHGNAHGGQVSADTPQIDGSTRARARNKDAHESQFGADGHLNGHVDGQVLPITHSHDSRDVGSPGGVLGGSETPPEALENQPCTLANKDSETHADESSEAHEAASDETTGEPLGTPVPDQEPSSNRVKTLVWREARNAWDDLVGTSRTWSQGHPPMRDTIQHVRYGDWIKQRSILRWMYEGWAWTIGYSGELRGNLMIWRHKRFSRWIVYWVFAAAVLSTVIYTVPPNPVFDLLANLLHNLAVALTT